MINKIIINQFVEINLYLSILYDWDNSFIYYILKIYETLTTESAQFI